MSLANIKHIVVLMLENRSLDNLLGWLYADTGNRPRVNIPPFPEGGKPVYYGLTENTYFNTFGGGDDTKHYVTKGASSDDIPHPDPSEPYLHVNRQLFGSEANPPVNDWPHMMGFLRDYYGDGIELSKQEALRIMETYTPSQLQVIHTLAKSYAVSDQWYSSIPTQTDCNRAFALAGTSLGKTDNAYPISEFDTPTLFHALGKKGIDWKVYYSEHYLWYGRCFTQQLFKTLHGAPKANFADLAAFKADAKAGTLPAFSFLEPAWFLEIENGTDYHPPAHLLPGERFLGDIFTALSTGKHWNETLFVVTFDEHGGTYDHYPPPWGATPPWGDGPPPYGLEHGFGFNRFGVRVPTILISPLIEKEVVFRSEKGWPSSKWVPYDHTSVIATVLKWKGIDPATAGLGARVANAPTFENVVTRTTPRTDLPVLPKSTLEEQSDIDVPLNGLQRHLLPLIVHNLSEGQLDIHSGENHATVQQILVECRTEKEFHAWVKRVFGVRR
jgi:phospholipase C